MVKLLSGESYMVNYSGGENVAEMHLKTSFFPFKNDIIIAIFYLTWTCLIMVETADM